MGFTVQYTITGGTPTYTVTLTGSGLPSNTHIADGIYTFEDVPEGVFTLDSVDANGCVVSEPIVLVASTTTPPPPSCTLVSFETVTTESSGSDGTITFTNIQTASGNLTYSINGGVSFQSSNIFTGLADGVYDVVVKDDVEVGCEISGQTRVFPQLETSEYTITFGNVTVINGGSGDGSIALPYNSNCEVTFNVVGNGGINGTFPSNYSISVSQTTINSNNVGVFYGDSGFKTNGKVITLVAPRGEVTTNVEVDQFNGGVGCDAGEHSMAFVNATSDGAAFISLNLYLNNNLVDSFGFYVNDNGSIPSC